MRCGASVMATRAFGRPVMAPQQVRFYAASLSGENKSILDHLLRTEIDAKDYYTEMAAKAKNEVCLLPSICGLCLLNIKHEQFTSQTHFSCIYSCAAAHRASKTFS